MELIGVAAGRKEDGANAEHETGTVIVHRKIRVSNFILDSGSGLVVVVALLAI